MNWNKIWEIIETIGIIVAAILGAAFIIGGLATLAGY